MTRLEVMAAARTWVDVPFRHGGRSRVGLDCIGLVVMVARALDVPHTDHVGYTAWPDPGRRLLAEMDQHLALCQPDEPFDGTIGVFVQQTSLPCHVGVFTRLHGAVHLTHAMMMRRRVLEEPFDTNPQTRIFRLIRRYRFLTLEN